MYYIIPGVVYIRQAAPADSSTFPNGIHGTASFSSLLPGIFLLFLKALLTVAIHRTYTKELIYYRVRQRRQLYTFQTVRIGSLASFLYIHLAISLIYTAVYNCCT